jgi:predicted RNA-binding Zn-ribbon protein involved in translation (DUF1610 family)
MRRVRGKSRKRFESEIKANGRCEPKGKVIFPNLEHATRAANRMTWKMRLSTGEVSHPYVCPSCAQWHIGRGPKGRDAAVTNGER